MGLQASAYKATRCVRWRIVSKAGKARTLERVRELEAFLLNLRKQTSDFKTL